jgi:Ran GTPase-activating protein (RanGAP) involved in mRNA processing and transport
MSENPQKNYQLVHIGSNLITGKGLSAICKGLVHSTELEELYVGNNPYEGDDSLMELIDILPSFTKLRILNLNNCALGDDELSYLSFMIDVSKLIYFLNTYFYLKKYKIAKLLSEIAYSIDWNKPLY